MRVGHWISSTIDSPTVSASGFSTWVDDVTRECLVAIPDTSISGHRVVRELTALIERRGKPGMIVSDDGTELTSNAILRWCSEHRVEWHYIAPRCPAGSCEA